ncbi:hypothetical protein C9374_003889 [Naegleria lovaniensis]|uniref:TLDc domain-containing protein n=1 Tax=Naegleria lovaniensis TaxID=51637 RepID=A0AA88H3V5_NAELO|nr:uncharacterized protein C9374_003889 [Naegleria lovaniensis]KAG2394125.1 hypothetical protein C9374_003889 [Naegleria lovaniensis]
MGNSHHTKPSSSREGNHNNSSNRTVTASSNTNNDNNNVPPTQHQQDPIPASSEPQTNDTSHQETSESNVEQSHTSTPLSCNNFDAPQLLGESSILIGDEGNSIAQQIRANLPLEQKLHNKWTMLYSNTKNGTSIATFAEIVMYHGPMLIFIKDMADNVFGAFSSVSLEKKPSFYGNSNCFLFKVETEENSEENNNSGKKSVKIFPASGRNDNYVYFNYGNKYNPYNGLAFGGRMGCFSLCIEEDWRFGKTCGDLITYSFSPQLSSDSEFEINSIECWIFPLSESVQIDLRYRAKAKQSKQALGEGNAAEIFILKQAGIMSSDNDHIRETAYQKDTSSNSNNNNGDN